MKLYREVNTNTGEPLSSLPGEMRLVEPIEITEEQIVAILSMYEKEWNGMEFKPLDVFQKDKVKGMASTILSKLKGEE